MQSSWIILVSVVTLILGIIPSTVSNDDSLYERRLLLTLERFLETESDNKEVRKPETTKSKDTNRTVNKIESPSQGHEQRGNIDIGTGKKNTSVSPSFSTSLSTETTYDGISSVTDTRPTSTYEEMTSSIATDRTVEMTTNTNTQIQEQTTPAKANANVGNYWERYNKLRCPVLERIMFENFQSFPTTEDMKDEIELFPEDLYCIFANKLQMLNILRRPYLIAEYLSVAVAEKIVKQKMVCPATKYQQAVVFALKRNFDHIVGYEDRALANRIYQKLRHFPNAQVIMLRIVSSIHSVLFKDFMSYILQEEFVDLGHMIDDLLEFAKKVFEEYSTKPSSALHSQVRHKVWISWATQTFQQYSNVLRCTSLNELIYRHTKIANDTLTGFYALAETGDLLVLTKHMLEDISATLIQPEIAHQLQVNEISVLILEYANKVIKVVQDYEYELLTGSLLGSVGILRPYISTDQVQALYEIIERLNISEDKNRSE